MESHNTHVATVMSVIHGEEIETWYKVVGDLSGRTHRPLMVLHGGPGMSHDYMLPIADLTQSVSIPVIFYDQLGSGRSTHLPHRGLEFWTIDTFIDQLDHLLNALDIEDDFDLLGHSWGGLLAAEYVVRRQPHGLRHLILSNAHGDRRLRDRSHALMRKRLPQSVQDALAQHETAGTVSSPEYREAITEFITRFVCTLPQPFPEPLQYSFRQMEQDNTVSKYLRSGNLKGWTIAERLNKVQVPTLLINGKDDSVQDFASAPYFENIPKVKWVMFNKSSHMPHWEERDDYMKVIEEFLND